MNDVTSLEVSKELYAVSGWGDTHNLYDPWGQLTTSRAYGGELPAYSLGYLLRKLPEEIDGRRFVLTNGERPHAGYADRDNYGDLYLDRRFYNDAAYADTPEDAAAKLAIELIKQDILKEKENDNVS